MEKTVTEMRNSMERWAAIRPHSRNTSHTGVKQEKMEKMVIKMRSWREISVNRFGCVGNGPIWRIKNLPRAINQATIFRDPMQRHWASAIAPNPLGLTFDICQSDTLPSSCQIFDRFQLFFDSPIATSSSPMIVFSLFSPISWQWEHLSTPSHISRAS